MSCKSHEFLQQCLLLDIEINERTIIYSLGSVFGDAVFEIPQGKPLTRRQLEEFDAFAAGARFVLGHNIINHDLPRLHQVAPFLNIFEKPAIDTLYLSPLAFPENPYHRLVKDYKLVRDSINEPVQDALLAGKVFTEQWDAFFSLVVSSPDVPNLYRSFLQTDSNLVGTADALGAMGISELAGNDLHDTFFRFAGQKACMVAVEQIADRLSENNVEHSVLAYVCAWLTVAGGNSVLPPWVRHRFPEISCMLHQLREISCGMSHCEYCRTHHDSGHFLRNFFGFNGFRSLPATADGKSLQEEIVRAGEQNKTLFATLPTGGGKSLCYLLPALMRYQRRNLLTIVISPLQALMKDQVDNFSMQTGTKIAAALSGMLTLPERTEVLDAICQGDLGILYVSPEQLRNQSFIRTVRQREIGAWVFDEAHCLSKWGHDFRPDYLYSIRFIREFAIREKTAIPPVQCFTATAKKDVKAEITDIIQGELGLRVSQFEGGHERANLHYEVWPADIYEKNKVVLELLRARYQGDGSVVIYCATRRNSEKLTEFLQNNGYTAEAFHAGLEPSIKKRVQESFIDGSIPVICATNAFGMGIDKKDVRLVIHADIPGSLENYLQEAGRAGRDRENADCVLIFTEQDIEGQFRLSSLSRLTKREIGQMLRGIRYASRGEQEVVLTAGELLRQEVVDIDHDNTHDADTRVRTAIAWLERAGFLERNENNTTVFQGKPLVRTLEEAENRIAEFNLSLRQQQRWRAIIIALLEKRPNQGFSADELAGLSAFAATDDDSESETETQRVIKTLNDMSVQGLLSKEMTLTAYLRYKVSNSSPRLLEKVCALEQDLLKVLQESAPDVETETPLELDLRQVNQQLVDRGHTYSSPQGLKLILYGVSHDGKGLAGRKGSLSIRARGNNLFTVYFHRQRESLVKTVKIRQQAAHQALQVMLRSISPTEKPSGDLLVSFTLEQIVESLRMDLMLLPQLQNPLAAAERALTFMHEQGIISLQQGLAVFCQSMTLRLNPDSRRRRYAEKDFQPLGTHYAERNFQIHVMNEYAVQALDKLGSAMKMVASYFNDEKEDFIRRFFPDRKMMLERATSKQSYTRIVEDLNNKYQQKIVTAGLEKNILVLAGPGAGKTRVVIHRVAYLLRVLRVNPKAILVLCFNRSAVMNLRKRLRELVGDDMNMVTTLTFHGLSLRLTGRSLAAAEREEHSEEIDFSVLILDAIKLLKEEVDVVGFKSGTVRETVIGGFSHILVDEYQDIDDDQYELVALLAGKTEAEKEQKMTILAVGDDDQNVYRFRGANVKFIRKFREDYEAEIHYLVENYRSTAHIIAAANQLIQNNSDRMKTGYPIRVNDARKMLPKGGNREIDDPIGRGRVQILEMSNPREQALAILETLRRLQSHGHDFHLKNCAVLCREWKNLEMIRSVLEDAGVPVSLNWARKESFPKLSRVRENALVFDCLKNAEEKMISAGFLLDFLPEQSLDDNIWQGNLRHLLNEWLADTHDTPQPVSLLQDYLYESLTEQRRSSNLGNGVFLSTIHSVKGLEFDHVLISADNWKDQQGEAMEEERRLYYVGMSRARETLHLCRFTGMRHPHIDCMHGDFLVAGTPEIRKYSKMTGKQYTMLGLDDLFMDFAGIRYENHPSRQALHALKTGALLQMEPNNDYLDLVNNEGVTVARLSKSARRHWLHRLAEISEIRVIAFARRCRDDVKDEEFRKRCYGEKWEVPIVEVVH